MNEENKKKMIEGLGGWSTDELHKDIACGLTTDNLQSNETNNIIEKYNVSYIFTLRYNYRDLYDLFFKTAKKDTNLYVTNRTKNDFALTEMGSRY